MESELSRRLADTALDSFADTSYSNTFKHELFELTTTTKEVEKLVWTTDAKGKRVLQKAKVAQTQTLTTLRPAEALTKARHTLQNVAEACLGTPTLAGDTHTRIAQWAHLTLVDQWMDLTCGLLDRVDKGSPRVDELLRHTYLFKQILPSFQTLTHRAADEGWGPLREWFRFLNQPFFHWHNRYTEFIQPELLGILAERFKVFLSLETCQEIYETYTHWTECLAPFRCATAAKEAKALLHVFLWDRNTQFQETALTKLKSLLTLPTEDAKILTALLPHASVSISTNLAKALAAHIVSVEKTTDIRRFTEQYHAYRALATTKVTLDAIGFAYTEMLKDAAMLEEYQKFLDSLLRNATKDTDAVAFLKKALALVTFIPQKDEFLASYHERLSRRLLSVSALHTESEEHVLTFLKLQVGHGYVNRLETMYKDVVHREPVGVGQGTTLRTLNYAAWNLGGLNHIPEWKIPGALKAATEAAKTLDTSKKLTYLPAHDSITLSSSFGGKTYSLVMTSIQASVLMLFDTLGKEVLTDAEIFAETGMPAHIGKGVLHSLSKTKVPLLTCPTPTTYRVVDKPASPTLVIRIPAPPFVSKPVVAGEKNAVEEGRQHVIDSAIVRILKSRRTILWTDLQMEVVKQLSHLFQPVPSMIKKRLESLIDREYCERDSENSAMLRYVA